MAMPTFGKLERTANMAKQLAKTGAVITDVSEMQRYYGGPELKHLSLEYLLSSNVFPLGIILQLFGAEATGKSTLAFSLLNEYFGRLGGDANLIDTEQKINNTLLESIMDPEVMEDDRFHIFRAPTQEKAQSILTILAKEINEVTHGKRRDSAPHLMGIALDSFRVGSEATQAEVLKNGFASKAFAVEANLWRRYLSMFSSLMQYVPMSLIVVNHQVEKDSPMGYGKVYDVGGGAALKFYETYRIQVKAIAKKSIQSTVYTDLALKSFKNSNGEANQVIYPRISYKAPEQPEGRIVVDWNIADAKLLSGTDIPRSKLAADGICDVKESSKAGLYNDAVNNLKMVPIEDIIQNLYESPDKLAAFRGHLGISTNRTVEELWEDGWFKDAKSASSFGED